MSNNTLSKLERHWPTFDFDSHTFTKIRSTGRLTVATSRSGNGMLLLQGIEVRVNEKWEHAHLSFPPDRRGTGTFTEGHLKIEGGRLLNQYFFSCDDNGTWEVEKLPNSQTIRTQNPGKWDLLGPQLWLDVDKLVTYLAYLPM